MTKVKDNLKVFLNNFIGEIESRLHLKSSSTTSQQTQDNHEEYLLLQNRWKKKNIRPVKREPSTLITYYQKAVNFLGKNPLIVFLISTVVISIFPLLLGITIVAVGCIHTLVQVYAYKKDREEYFTDEPYNGFASLQESAQSILNNVILKVPIIRNIFGINTEEFKDAVILLAEAKSNTANENTNLKFNSISEYALIKIKDRDTKIFLLMRQIGLLLASIDSSLNSVDIKNILLILNNKVQELSEIDSYIIAEITDNIKKFFNELILKFEDENEVNVRFPSNMFHGLLMHEDVVTYAITEYFNIMLNIQYDQILTKNTAVAMIKLLCVLSSSDTQIQLKEHIQSQCIEQLKLGNVKAINLPKRYYDKLMEIEIIDNPRRMLGLADIQQDIINNNILDINALLLNLLFDEKLGKHIFSKNQTWLHILVRLEVSEKDIRLLHQVIGKLIENGLSPYARDDEYHSAFSLIPDNDPNQIERMFAAKLDYGLFGVSKQIKQISSVLEDVKINPSCNRHALLLSGMPGTGKTFLAQYLSKQLGFKFVEFDRANADDKYVNQLSSRLLDKANELKKLNIPVVLFFDEIDSLCPSANFTLENHTEKHFTQTWQTIYNQLKGLPVVIIGATNYPSQVAAAVKSRAEEVKFECPKLLDRDQMFKHFLRYIQIESDLPLELAKRTAGMTQRTIEYMVEKILREVTKLPITLDDCLGIIDIPHEQILPNAKIVPSGNACSQYDNAYLKLCFEDSFRLLISKSREYLQGRSQLPTKVISMYGGDIQLAFDYIQYALSATNSTFVIINNKTSLGEVSDYLSQIEVAVLFVENFEEWSKERVQNLLEIINSQKENRIIAFTFQNEGINKQIVGAYHIDIPKLDKDQQTILIQYLQGKGAVGETLQSEESIPTREDISKFYQQEKYKLAFTC